MATQFPHRSHFRWMLSMALRTTPHRRVVLASSLLCMAACSSVPFVPFEEGIVPPRTVAVMPLDDHTDSEDGAAFVRRTMCKTLNRKGYTCLPMSDMDKTLAERFGSQVKSATSSLELKEIGEELGVDAVMTGALLKFGNKKGSLTEADVSARFRLYESTSGRPIWDWEGTTSRANLVPFSPENLGAKFAEWLMDSPHQRLVLEFFDDVMKELPNGAGSSEYEQLATEKEKAKKGQKARKGQAKNKSRAR